MRLKTANETKSNNMKKFLSVALIIAAASFCKAQSITFKIGYQPDHNYQLTGNMKMSITSDLSSVPKLSDMLTKQGITEPVNAVLDMQLVSSVITGHADAGQPFSYLMSFSMPSMGVTVNGKQMPIPVPKNTATKIFGHITSGQLSVDSLNGQKVPDSVAQKTMGMMNSMLKMVKFPEHPLKVGESFTQQVPLNIPMLNGVSNNIATTYTLVSVQGNTANFDVKMDMNMSMDIKGKVKITMTGSGSGTMAYDIKQSFPISYTTNANMQINVKAENINVSGTMQMGGTMNYVITTK
jgi:hypothetical protein